MSLPDYQVTNDAGRVTVYLLHGIYGAKDYWRYQVARLVQRGYRVVAWEAPGYGLSPLPENFSFELVAEAGARLIRATASERNVVFGHSMGGQITPRILLKVPGLAHAAVITATIGYFGNRTKEEQEEFVRKRTVPPPPGTDPHAAQLAVVNGMLGPTSAGPEVELVRAVAAATPPRTVQAAVKAVQAYPETEAVAAIKAIAVPTLLVAGEVDQTGHPAGMRRVADMIAHCEFAVISGSGHYPWAENPDEFNRHFFAFLERHVPARERAFVHPLERTMTPEEKLKSMGLTLPPVPNPVANYVPFKRAGEMLYLSGQGPRKPGGGFISGKVGKDVTWNEAYEHAKIVGLQLLAAAKMAVGDLSKVEVIKVLGMVNAVPEFGDQPKVINGCSDLFVEVLGERGRHARSAVGMGSLPNQITVEIEAVLRVVE
jgi:pimeloyl-ACP methyl ester carboxylesterase/enamine deaminase RidA (YjgF/YER057c/UK114 family)